jgi:hypothetical protein
MRRAPRERVIAAQSPSLNWTRRRLTLGVTAVSIAVEARDAGLAFLDGSASRWGKRDLADWLSGPYAAITSYAGARHHRQRRASDSIGDELDIAPILLDARWHVLAELEAAALPFGQPEFAERLLARGYVVPARADDGIAWLPIDGDGRLWTRVLSLFAADALARPRDYASALYVCHRCESVVFDAFARQRGNCGHHETDPPRRREVPPPRAALAMTGSLAFDPTYP